MEQDTITAISTPLGIGGIGIIRLSGPAAYRIIGRIFRPRRQGKMADWATHSVRYGHIMDGTRRVDEVLVTIMRAPSSYTREDMAEIGCHGGPAALKETLTVCLKNGARLAEPGEFTRRAFLNGRIDLAQAESVLAVIESRTGKALEVAVNSLGGNLTEAAAGLREKTLAVLAQIEALIDFPEETGVNREVNLPETLASLLADIGGIQRRGRRGGLFFNGVKAAIVGGANVGKSSLLNALLREERALVSEIPGTTRDFLHETIVIKGIPVKIIDTAGIRQTRGRIERMGVRKALEWMDKAEIIILVLDAGQPLRENDRKLLAHLPGRKYLVALNKTDRPAVLTAGKLREFAPARAVVPVSAKYGRGIEQLEEKLYTIVVQNQETDGEEFLVNARQDELLRRVSSALKRACGAARRKTSLEFVAEDLRQALAALDGIGGRNVSEEVLNTIFSRFCIGK